MQAVGQGKGKEASATLEEIKELLPSLPHEVCFTHS